MFPKEDGPCAIIMIWDHIAFLTLVMLDGKEIQMGKSSFFIFFASTFSLNMLNCFLSYNYEDITATVFKSIYSI